MIILIIILSILLSVSIIFLLLYKREIVSLCNILNTIGNKDTNMKLTTKTFDKDICALSKAINNILESQRGILLKNERANKEFRQAITNISHDLRTPLTSSLGYIQMLKSDKTSEHKKKEYFDIIEYRLKALSGIINELFEYTRIVEGNITFKEEKINICNVLRDSISTFYNEFEEKNFTVELSIPDKPMFIFCDLSSLERVIQNLIQNILLHGEECFYLIVDSTHNKIIFRNKIANTEELDVELLFERFYTSDLSRSGKTTGLGLAIARELIISMGYGIEGYVEGDMLSICLSV